MILIIYVRQGLVVEAIKLHLTDSKLRISNDAASAINEVVLAFLQETLWRSMNQAFNEGLHLVNLDHLEKILPQLVIVFNYCGSYNMYTQL